MKFERLIRKHSNVYTFNTTGVGYFVGPTWVEGSETEIDIDCSIFPFSTKDVVEYEGLGYTTKDIKIFIPVTEETDLSREDTLIYKGDKYQLDREMDRTTHSDFVKWFAKRVENQ
jgi:hypothetical protein